MVKFDAFNLQECNKKMPSAAKKQSYEIQVRVWTWIVFFLFRDSFD